MATLQTLQWHLSIDWGIMPILALLAFLWSSVFISAGVPLENHKPQVKGNPYQLGFEWNLLH